MLQQIELVSPKEGTEKIEKQFRANKFNQWQRTAQRSVPLQYSGLIHVHPASLGFVRLADVYEVAGAAGRECQVQLAFGSSTKETKDWVSPGAAWVLLLQTKSCTKNVNHF